jgi:hypothetical protein
MRQYVGAVKRDVAGGADDAIAGGKEQEQNRLLFAPV